jgi:hypothetical protein
MLGCVAAVMAIDSPSQPSPPLTRRISITSGASVPSRLFSPSRALLITLFPQDISGALLHHYTLNRKMTDVSCLSAHFFKDSFTQSLTRPGIVLPKFDGL